LNARQLSGARKNIINGILKSAANRIARFESNRA
jgi:hypothetical protein